MATTTTTRRGVTATAPSAARGLRNFRSPRTAPELARSAPLEGLRGCAAIAVLVFHAWLYRPHGTLPGPRHALGDKILFELNLGLICFFVLSGFLLFRPFARAATLGAPAPRLRTYAVRRAARIVPAYYACIALTLVLYAVVGAHDLIPPADQVVRFALFAQSYWPSTLTAIDAVTWTLCVEVAFYLLLPLLGLLAVRLAARPRALTALLAGMVAFSAGWNTWVNQSGWGSVAGKSLAAYIGDFALGMLAAVYVERSARHAARRLSRRTATAPAGGLALALAGSLLVIATGYWHERWGSHTLSHQILMDLPAAAGFALLVAAVAQRANPAARLLGSRPLREAGTVSYGLYLWHIPLILVLDRLHVLPQGLAPRLALVAALTSLAATASWRLIERPALARAHRQGRRVSRTATVQTAP